MEAAPLDPAAGDAEPTAPLPSRAGRNLPAAIISGVALLVAFGLSLWFRPEPFVALVVLAVGAGLWELRQAFARQQVRLPYWPLLVGGAGAAVSAFTGGPEGLLLAYVLTVAAVVVWRLIDGPGPQALRDAAAGVFAATYVPFLAGFVVLLLGQADGRERVVLFVLLAVANDTGGYIAGVLFGRHPLARTVSPKKSWEGFGGSVVLAVGVGVAGAVGGLGASPWLGVALGVMVAITATLGDLAESLIKRDLELKDMGSLLPGHGGVLDRIDSLLATAPFVYLVLSVAA
ncbi:phosphatidate cytidylyltransferase [Puerhibacterium puerhi]|uniref:phosphatidate cytidylyltransferase n=1 Tax=Puerhibacterium puerhi TaxID=2692623 RepID=UPI00135B0F6A|nr:phosphatidate cytidylyltransferase [Puerhibacterium puerhi]